MGQVRMPDGTVYSEAEFRQRVANNQIAAGPGGSAANNAVSSGSYSDPYAGSTPATTSSASSSTGAAQTAASTAFGSGMSTPNPGDSSIPAGARDENVYALRNNDDPTGWAKRVFAQGTADYGAKSLNPYLDQNPMANSPFAQWYQQRFGTAAPTNALVAQEISGGAPTADNIKGAMQSAATGGVGAMGPNNVGDARNNLTALNNMVKQQAAGGGSNNTTQRLFAGQLLNDPQLASQIVTSQLQGGTGGWGMGYLANQASNLANHYFNDPANQGPQGANGSFLNQLMRQMGMA